MLARHKTFPKALALRVQGCLIQCNICVKKIYVQTQVYIYPESGTKAFGKKKLHKNDKTLRGPEGPPIHDPLWCVLWDHAELAPPSKPVKMAWRQYPPRDGLRTKAELSNLILMTKVTLLSPQTKPEYPTISAEMNIFPHIEINLSCNYSLHTPKHIRARAIITAQTEGYMYILWSKFKLLALLNFQKKQNFLDRIKTNLENCK